MMQTCLFIALLFVQAEPEQSVPPLPLNPQAWISSNDYPTSAMRHSREETVQFLLKIDENGKVRSCEIISSSGAADLDRTTCKKVRQRAEFSAALDKSGNKVPGEFVSKITWKIPFPYDVRMDRTYLGFLASKSAPLPDGILVTTVLTGPARLAGLQTGDIVRKINGQSVASFQDLAALAATIPIGQTYSLEVERRGQLIALQPQATLFPPEDSSEAKVIKEEMWKAYMAGR